MTASYVFQLDDYNKCKEVKEILNCLILNDEKVQKISDIFESEMNLALAEKPSSLQMENTYIPELPDGTEEGVYLALDLGGTNFRVILLELKNSKVIREEVKHYHICDTLRVGCGNKLFDFLAESVDDFVREKNLTTERIPMGFTFSFPMKQHSLDSGCLITWTKSFNCPSSVGQDAVQLLRQSLHKIGRDNIDVLAILNDTTGTLVQGATLDKNTRIGIVLGTGTNGAYLEYANRVQHWETQRHGEKTVVIDVEWGAFGDNGVLDFIKTDFDREVDNGSLLVNSFTFEKYIGGKYLGEVCRVVLKKLIHEKILFVNRTISNFPEAYNFGTDNVSKIEQDVIDGTMDGIKSVMKKMDLVYERDYNINDVKIIRYVCHIISVRAAQLTSICTSVILKRMDEKNITIAIDGSVYKHHPNLKNWITDFTKQKVLNKNIKFILAEDGSGKGAALVAAIAKKLRQRNLTS